MPDTTNVAIVASARTHAGARTGAEASLAGRVPMEPAASVISAPRGDEVGEGVGLPPATAADAGVVAAALPVARVLEVVLRLRALPPPLLLRARPPALVSRAEDGGDGCGSPP